MHELMHRGMRRTLPQGEGDGTPHGKAQENSSGSVWNSGSHPSAAL